MRTDASGVIVMCVLLSAHEAREAPGCVSADGQLAAEQLRELIEILIERARLRPLLDAYGYRKDPRPIAKARAPPQTDLDFGG